jgi:hypothetical protein
MTAENICSSLAQAASAVSAARLKIGNALPLDR